MEAAPDYLDCLPFEEKDCTASRFEAEQEYDDGRETGDNKQQQQNGENCTNTKPIGKNRHGVISDAEVVVEIENGSVENDVEVLINQNESLTCVGAGSSMSIQLPHNIRSFRLKNSKSGSITGPLPFDPNNRHLRVEDWRHGSDLLHLFSEATSRNILRF